MSKQIQQLKKIAKAGFATNNRHKALKQQLKKEKTGKKIFKRLLSALMERYLENENYGAGTYVCTIRNYHAFANSNDAKFGYDYYCRFKFSLSADKKVTILKKTAFIQSDAIEISFDKQKIIDLAVPDIVIVKDK